MDKKKVVNLSAVKKHLPELRKLLSSFLFLVCAFLTTLVFIIALGLSERTSMHVGIVLGLIITLFFLRFFPFSQETKVGTTRILKESVTFLILMELLLILFTPLHSLIPEKVLLRLNILRNIEDVEECNTKVEVAIAENFMKNAVNLTQVKIYYGGEPQFTSFMPFFPKTNAAAYGNFVYVAKTASCVNSATLVHELAHVWQYQHGLGFGPKWIPYWIDYYWKYFTNFKSLYDYGGMDGINKAISEGKSLTDFGLEQQASIVETYYIVLTTSYYTGASHLSRSENFNTLSSFMNKKIIF